jgi:hypothetical protein
MSCNPPTEGHRFEAAGHASRRVCETVEQGNDVQNGVALVLDGLLADSRRQRANTTDAPSATTGHRDRSKIR